MCDFTRSSVASTAEHSHVYMEKLEEREAVMRSFTVPQIWSAVSLSYFLCLRHTNTHNSMYCISSPHSPHPSPSPFGLILPSPLRHPTETNSGCCSTPSWHVGQGRWSPFRFSAPTSLPSSSSPVAAPSLLLNISSTRLVYQQGC